MTLARLRASFGLDVVVMSCGFGPSIRAAFDPDLARGAAIKARERRGDLPIGLMREVASTESAHVSPGIGTNAPWPWTIDVAGASYCYDSDEEAEASAQATWVSGAWPIDFGCTQVTPLSHQNAFPSLIAAFNPTANVTYAAALPKSFNAEFGDWHRATAAYHSRTPGPGTAYLRRTESKLPNRDVLSAGASAVTSAVLDNCVRASGLHPTLIDGRVVQGLLGIAVASARGDRFAAGDSTARHCLAGLSATALVVVHHTCGCAQAFVHTVTAAAARLMTGPCGWKNILQRVLLIPLSG